MIEYKEPVALFGRSGIRRQILALLLDRPEARYHLRAIARAAGTSAGTAARELQRLVDAGLVFREREGRQVYFQARTDSPLYLPVRELVRRTVAGGAVLRRALQDLAGIESALVFGSYASGAADARSDIDVLVVGEPDRDALTDRLQMAERELGRPINEVVFSAGELARRRQDGDPFIASIDQDPTIALVP